MKKQQGLTMIEIMISLALGLFILAATLTVYIGTIRSSSNAIKSARLNHDLGLAMSLMSNDIKRAGYWGGAVIGANNLLSNPFTTATADIQIFNLAAPTTALTTMPGDCILYSYDGTNGDGVVDSDEYYGFRLNNGVIEMRLSGTATTNCNDNNDVWQAITDGNMVNITAVQFSFAPLGTLTGVSRCLNSATGVVTDALICNPAPTAGQRVAQKRLVNIQLTGQLRGADNAEVTKTLSDTVKVRNNRVFTQ